MKLVQALFYQTVKNFDGNESNTFKASQTVKIDLEDHLVKICQEGSKQVLIVPTANLRCGIADYVEAYNLPHVAYKVETEKVELAKEPDCIAKLKEPTLIASPKELEQIKEEFNSSETPMSSKKKKAHVK